MHKGTLALSALVFFSLLPPALVRSAQAVADFDLEGVAVFQCQCPAHACPCQKNGGPTHGTCESADFVHIRSGRYGTTQLDGLNAVVAGNLVDQTKARLYATIYIDQRADAAQRAALAAIEQFLNGAYDTSSLQASAVKFVPVSFRESPDKSTYNITIPGILAERTIIRRDASGTPLSTETAMDSWANVEHYADNIKFDYRDKAARKSWDHSGAYANIKYFHLTKKLYDNKEMLAQYGDFSGHWTAEQLDLIHRQGLPEN
jgi:hypothetical protein